MRLVTVRATCGPSPLFRLKDADTGIEYPNLLTAEQINSEAVVEAATTYIKMKQREQVLQLTTISPLLMSVLDYIGWCGVHSSRLSAKKPTPAEAPVTLLTAPERKLLLNKIEQLKRTIVHLEDRNERQARIIRAVQGAVRGDVQ